MYKFKKRVDAVHEGDGAANGTTPTNHTGICCVCQKVGVTKSCGKCKSAQYCSKSCQKQHIVYHRKYCSAIMDLESLELQKLYKDYSVREEQIDVMTKTKLIKLIGVRPMLKCFLDDGSFEVLWDTGSMISLMDIKWVKKYFPDKKMYPIKDFLENQTLQIQAANSTEITFEGVMLFNFSFKDNKTFCKDTSFCF